MLYLQNNNATNVIYTNLLERLPLSALASYPVAWSWLMVFTNDFTKESYTALQIMNISAFAEPKNSNLVRMPLTVINTGTPNGLIQQIKLKDKGYYTYQIFYQNSLTNLDVNNASVTELVQTGKALAWDGNAEVDFNAQIDGTPNNFIYVP